MGARLIHPDVPPSRSLNLSASGSSPSFPQGAEQRLQCLGARQRFLALLRKQAVCAKCELQSVGFPWLSGC